jgi:tetratricopeptide (TPR) repeat protein
LTKKQGRLLAKLADLGLARAAGAAESRVTSDGCTVGTVDFMAPEQARDSGRADTRSDIYSLGCTLFHMLAGRPPFANGTLMERVVKHAAATPPDLCKLNPAVPAQLWDVCRRMLAKRPADRYQTPAELLIALTSLSHLLSEAAAGGGLTSTASGARLASPPSRRNVRGPSTADGRAGASSSRIPSPAISNSPGLTLAGTATLTDAGQRRVAFEQYEHARVALKAGNDDYALSLLLTCCRLAPADLTYRQALRQAQIHRRGGSWHPWPVRCYYRLRLELARRRHQPLQALADGEELLTCAPGDLHVQLAMAQAAIDANLPDVAIWMLEQAKIQSPTARAILRPLAILYEQQGDARHARRLWEALLEEDKANEEARRHLQQLLVQQSSVVQSSHDAVPAAPARHGSRHLIM